MRKRKVCVVTGSRAEYGLLYWTMKGLQSTPGIELQLLVTGMHLSPEFGLTYKQIEGDGFFIDRKVEMILSSDSTVGITKSMGLGMIGYAEALSSLNPDVLLVLGDRYEIFSAAAAAMVHRIPIAHCHGGETSEGVIDESIRHSITKMSHLHFTSTETYRKRVIQLGESPKHVFNVGALGIENINKLQLLNKTEFEASINFALDNKVILVTFHPVTLEKASAGEQFNALLSVLKEIKDTKIIFTKANADTDGRIINQMIDDFVQLHRNRAVAFTSLGQLKYLSALQFVDVVVGNSSSGLIEVPSFKKATINIGVRQKGRIAADSVINCTPDVVDIRKAFDKANATSFRKALETVENPYGTGNASEKIVDILGTVELEPLLKKTFYDL